MLDEGPRHYNESIRNIVFDIGISWGMIIKFIFLEILIDYFIL